MQRAIASAARFHSNPQLLVSLSICDVNVDLRKPQSTITVASEFAEYLSQAGVISFSELSPPLLAAFIVERAPGMAPRTRRDLYGHLRVLLWFGHREGITNRDLSGAVGMSQVYRLDDVLVPSPGMKFAACLTP
jgi:hypothetical protein